MKKRIFNLYVDSVCDSCGILKTDLFSKKKLHLYSNARFILYYICSQRPMKVIEIKDLCVANGYNLARQSIDYGIKKIKDSIDDPDNKDIRILIESCLKALEDD